MIFVSDKTNKFDGLASKKGLLDLMSKIRTGNLNRNDMHEKPPQTPHTSPKNKIAWIVADQPLKFK